MIVGTVVVAFCWTMYLITRPEVGSPSHLLVLHRAPAPAEVVRIDAAGPHELPTDWSTSFGIIGTSQTPGQAHVLVDGKEITVLRWTDYQAHATSYCESPVSERLPYFLAHVAPGSTVTVEPEGLGGDWYVDIVMYPLLKDCPVG
ncbi:hypothetical protein [Catellatospora sp. TT07R-123]|uniref:hypothetical protein n=1 Tax=Catellatospora sp. TT07R-123 TaxID=2733863 RepID=UPI001BB4138D|nr:hypothetical protein [Catellatospora sp. TT07R-123]